VKALEGADQTSPDKPVNEHHAAQVPPPLVEEREFLQGMSPPSSPVAKPSQPASNNKDPTWAASETAAADTENPSSATRSMVGREKEGALAGGSIAVPLVAAANVDRQSGEILEPMESEEEGGGTRINNRPVEQLLQSVEPKVSFASSNRSTKVRSISRCTDSARAREEKRGMNRTARLYNLRGV